MKTAVVILNTEVSAGLLVDLDKLYQTYVKQRVDQFVNHQQGEFTHDELNAVMAGAVEAWKAKFPTCCKVRVMLVDRLGEPHPPRTTHADIADQIWPTGWPT